MSRLYRNATIGAGAVASGIFLVPRGQKPIETLGPKNDPNRMPSGGGMQMHTPGVATQRDSSQVSLTQDKAEGVDTKHIQENRVDQDRSCPEKASNSVAYDQEAGK